MSAANDTASDHGTVRAHCWVSGKVQGVFFRANTRKRAEKLGINGWVKNLKDGRVEAVLEGSEEDVKELIGWLHQGPKLAQVEEVEVDWKQPQGLKQFTIKR